MGNRSQASVRNNMKGVSPLIGTTILIVIAVALGVLILSWQGGFLQNFSAELKESVKLQQQCSQASISIESASFDCNFACGAGIDHTLTLQTTNRGNHPLTVTYVYLKNLTGSTFEYSVFESLNVGETKQIINTSQTSCVGINQSLDEIILLTNCLDTATEFSGGSINWINC